MTRLRLWLVTLIALVMGGAAVSQQPVQAAAGAQYTVSPVIPDNQRTAVSSYFDLVVKPGATQNLTVAITNHTNAIRHLRLSLTTAYSQHNGQIAYKPNGPKDSSAQYRLTDLGTPSQAITLRGGETKQVTVRLKIPAQGFKGVLLGGLYLVDLAKSQGGSTGGVQVKNQFATIVAVQLQTSPGAMNQIKPQLKLIGVGAGIQNSQPGVLATVQNPQPTYWGKMHFVGKVTPRHSDRVLMKQTGTDYAVAPNSHFDFGVLQKKALAPGDYTLDLLITGPHGRWHFKRHFSILTDQANRINKKLGLKRQFVLPWWGWVLIGLGLASLVWLLWLWRQRRQQTRAKKAAPAEAGMSRTRRRH